MNYGPFDLDYKPTFGPIALVQVHLRNIKHSDESQHDEDKNLVA